MLLLDNIKALILLGYKLHFKEIYSFQFAVKGSGAATLVYCSLVLQHVSRVDDRGSGSCRVVSESVLCPTCSK